MFVEPDFRFRHLHDIDLESLRSSGVRLLLVDIDNTLVPWGAIDVDERLQEWISEAGKLFEIVLVSNRRSKGAKILSRKLGLNCISPAYKPFPLKMKWACATMGISPSESAIIGDQIVTDILAGKLGGYKTVLLEPISNREFTGTKINRAIERWLFGRRTTTAKRE